MYFLMKKLGRHQIVLSDERMGRVDHRVSCLMRRLVDHGVSCPMRGWVGHRVSNQL